MTASDATSSLEAWTLALARPTIAPAGGSAAAITAAMAASLVGMVSAISLERQPAAATHAGTPLLHATAERLRAELLDLAGEDSRVFAGFGDALRLPAGTGEERATRNEAKRRALAEGARVQLHVLRRAAEIADMGERVAAVAPPSTLGDTATAVFLAVAAARSAYWAVRDNLGGDHDEAATLLECAAAAGDRMAARLTQRFG